MKSLGGRIPETGHENLKLARDVMAWREYRTSTKNLLCAISNCLQQSMPSGWTMVNCKPPKPLAPQGVTGERYPYLVQEQKLKHHPLGSAWRIIPVSKWLVTPIYKPFRPFIRGITPFRGLTNHGY